MTVNVQLVGKFYWKCWLSFSYLHFHTYIIIPILLWSFLRSLLWRCVALFYIFTAYLQPIKCALAYPFQRALVFESKIQAQNLYTYIINKWKARIKLQVCKYILPTYIGVLQYKCFWKLDSCFQFLSNYAYFYIDPL